MSNYLSLTHKFIDGQLRTQSINKKLAHGLRKKWVQEDYEECLSFVNYYLWYWCVEGTFDSFLQDNEYVSYPTILNFLNKKYQTKIFKNGKDALTRELTGSRTQAEMDKGHVLPDSLSICSTSPDIVVEVEDSGNVQNVVVSRDTDSFTDEVTRIRSEYLKDVIRVCSRNVDDYLELYEGLCAEKTIRQISEEMGIAKSQSIRRLKSTICGVTETTRIIVQEMLEGQTSVNDLQSVLNEEQCSWLDNSLKVLQHKDLVWCIGDNVSLTNKGKQYVAEGIL